MTLKQGKNNKTYQVLSINIELLLERRLEALGLKKGALTARFRGTRFALGKRIADHIEVKEVTE